MSWQEAQFTASFIEAIYIPALESICGINLILICQRPDCTEGLQTAVYCCAVRKSRERYAALSAADLEKKRR